MSPLNKPSDLWYHSNTAVYGGNEYGKSGHFFEALNDAFKVHFQGFIIFTPYQ